MSLRVPKFPCCYLMRLVLPSSRIWESRGEEGICMQRNYGNIFEHIMHWGWQPAEKSAKGGCSVSWELGSCRKFKSGSSSPEPGSKMKPWLWRLVEGCLPLSYFFPQTPHDPYLWLLPKSPPLHFPGSLALGLNAQGVNCRDGIHHTGKKFISVIDVSLDSTRVEKRGDVEGRWKVWNTQGTDRGHGCSLRL